MSNTQSIIVYHNPAQAAFWEGGYFIPLLGAMSAGIVVFLLLAWIAEKLSPRWQGPNNFVMGAVAASSFLVGVFVFNWLFI